MMDFASRAETAQRPEMNAALSSLLGASELDPSILSAWMPDWKLAFKSAMESNRVDPRIHPPRLNYYEKAIQAILASDNPLAALWPLLQTWCLAVDALPEPALEAWGSACGQLGLTVPGFEQRVEGFDRFLDEVEALLDELATQYGLETSTSF